MSLAKRFYRVLLDILVDTHDLDPEFSLLQADRAIAKRFELSESTARNWRRGKYAQVSSGTAAMIISICEKIAPDRVPDLVFLDRLSGKTHEIKLAAELLVDELTNQVLSYNSTWNIYSGPLKMAFDLNADPGRQLQLMSRASMVTERILEIGVDQTNIPCLGELIRYSTHGWYVKGFMKIREVGLSSEITRIDDRSIGRIEAALYIGDGCAVPCLFSGNIEKARAYVDQALGMLQEVDSSDEHNSLFDKHEALSMIRSIQVLIACHDGFEQNRSLITTFLQDCGKTSAENSWIEGTRQEALGYIDLVRRTDFAKAAYHFEQAGNFMDNWLAQFGIPFSSTSPQSLRGYALLMTQGPTESVKLQISEGLLRTIDHGAVCQQIRARLCQSLYYDASGDSGMSEFHHGKARELVQQYDLLRWYNMLNGILLAKHPGQRTPGQAF